MIKEEHKQYISLRNQVEQWGSLSREREKPRCQTKTQPNYKLTILSLLFKILEEALIAKWIIKCKIWKVALFYILLGQPLLKSVFSFAFRKDSQNI